MEGCLVKSYFQDEDLGSEALARTQVCWSKTKLKNVETEYREMLF